MEKSNHKVPVVKITDVRKHPNADTLDIITVEGYQVISKTGNFKVGDLGVYIQPDSMVPEAEQFTFLWGDSEKPVPVRRRRITVKKLRGEWSEGLLLPVSDFPQFHRYVGAKSAIAGDDVAEFLGITHYDPDAGKEMNADNETAPGSRQNRVWPRSWRGWLHWFKGLFIHDPVSSRGNEKAPVSFRPVYDVEAYKNFKNAFQNGDRIMVTEKIHGSNARYTFVPGLFGDGKMYAGSRNFWKKEGSHNIWRQALKVNPWIEKWCRQNPNYTLYGEVTPTQKGYEYGATPEEPRFFVFDILDPQGKWVPLDQIEFHGSKSQCFVGSLDGLQVPLNFVPVLQVGEYSDDHLHNFMIHVDGPSAVLGAKNPREGIVIRAFKDRTVRGLGRLQLKIVSNAFLEKDSK